MINRIIVGLLLFCLALGILGGCSAKTKTIASTESFPAKQSTWFIDFGKGWEEFQASPTATIVATYSLTSNAVYEKWVEEAKPFLQLTPEDKILRLGIRLGPLERSPNDPFLVPADLKAAIKRIEGPKMNKWQNRNECNFIRFPSEIILESKSDNVQIDGLILWVFDFSSAPLNNLYIITFGFPTKVILVEVV